MFADVAGVHTWAEFGLGSRRRVLHQRGLVHSSVVAFAVCMATLAERRVVCVCITDPCNLQVVAGFLLCFFLETALPVDFLPGIHVTTAYEAKGGRVRKMQRALARLPGIAQTGP